MDANTVIYSDTISGQQISITLADLQQNEEVYQTTLYAGVKRILQSATTNKPEGETNDGAKLKRVQNFKDGKMWSRGGGHGLSEQERHRRAVLAAYATTHLNLSWSEAEDRIRKDNDGILSETASAMYQKKYAEKPSKDRLKHSVETLSKMVQKEVKRRMQQDDNIPEEI